MAVYKVKVKTGDLEDCDTNANVYIKLHGTYGDSGMLIVLSDVVVVVVVSIVINNRYIVLTTETASYVMSINVVPCLGNVTLEHTDLRRQLFRRGQEDEFLVTTTDVGRVFKIT